MALRHAERAVMEQDVLYFALDTEGTTEKGSTYHATKNNLQQKLTEQVCIS